MNRVPRILFVSRVYPADFERAVFGIFQRMRVVLDAVQATGAMTRLLFFTFDKEIRAAPSAQALSALFLERWGIIAEIVLVRSRERQANAWNTYAGPALDYAGHADYWPVAGSAQVAALENALDAGVDLLVVHRLGAMVPVLRSRRRLPPVMFDLDDIEHIKLSRELARPSAWRGRRLLRFQVPALRRLETAAIRLAACTLVCSQTDHEYLAGRFPAAALYVLHNSVDCSFVPAPPPRRQSVMFVGSFSYAPNAEAAAFLIRDIWPKIVAALPLATLMIVGNYAERIAGFSQPNQGVEFAGFVPDLAAVYARTAIVCCPILGGGGTRIKILEAAAHARPTIATTIGAEGLALSPGLEIVLADDAVRLAEQCIRLLKNPDAAQAMGAAARVRVQETYDRRKIVTALSEKIRAIL